MIKRLQGKFYRKWRQIKLVALNLDQIAERTSGKILQGSPSLVFSRFNIDSRLVGSGDLFFALISERNGHDFIHDSAQNGAAGAVVSQNVSPPQKDFALLEVNNTLQALQTLAKKILSEQNTKVIGITGSAGKTTTKEVTYSLLSPLFNTLKSEGNYNNHIGLPLSLLNLTPRHELAVLEMGMSSAGEISTLTDIAPPDIAVITNIHPVHLEFFNSVEEIALAKKEILDGKKKDGAAVLNGDDILVRKISQQTQGEKIFFGLSRNNDIRASNIKKNGITGMSFEFSYGKDQAELFLPFFYTSYLYNFLAASGTAFVLDVPFEEILSRAASLQPYSKRGILHNVKGNIKLIDDSYNSNPAALESALTDLVDLPGKRKIAILGDMLELGKNEADFHTHAGKQAAKLGIDLLVTIGPLSLKIAEGALSEGLSKNKIISFEDSEEAAEKIEPLLEEGDTILVKGSRGIKTEKIVNKIKSKG
jgi:UDP-N-acetylmuramoyl-tripeptide--D-alanyl-D-alanine ligase